MRQWLLAFSLLPVRGFVVVSPSPIQRHRCENAKHTFLPPTWRRDRSVRPPTALSLANAEAGLLSSPVFWSVTNRVQELFGPLGADGPDYFAASIKFQMWLSVSSLVSFASQILLRDAAALSAGTAGALDRVPLELGVFGLFCLLNIFELALVPTTFLNLGLIEVVEDFVERQQSAEGTPDAIDAP